MTMSSKDRPTSRPNSATARSRLERSLDELQRQAKRLSEDQGRIARRNARNAVLEALRACRSALDREFPLEKKPVKRRKKRSAQRREEEFQRNWAPIVASTERFVQIQRAGIKVIARNDVNATTPTTRWFAPRWAVFAPPGTTVEELRRARRSPTERKALLTMGTLAIEAKAFRKLNALLS
jgi:hypothetical protein